MNIQGIGGSLYGSSGYQRSLNPTTQTGGDSELDQLIAYFKETPAQRMEDDWLSAHHITKEQFAAMSPAQQAAITKQMTDDIKNKIKQRTEGQLQDGVNALA